MTPDAPVAAVDSRFNASGKQAAQPPRLRARTDTIKIRVHVMGGKVPAKARFVQP